jgi:enoyl-CoA hydratase/carnithine racemase
MADDTTDAVLLEIDGPIATVTLNRPDRLNACSWEMGMALAQRMETVAADRDVRVVVLRGAGRSFCAGIDLKPDVRDRIVGRSPAEKVLNYYLHRYRGPRRRAREQCRRHAAARGAPDERALLRDGVRFNVTSGR